jgi:tetratricopeptide (TPR) repeat protein
VLVPETASRPDVRRHRRRARGFLLGALVLASAAGGGLAVALVVGHGGSGSPAPTRRAAPAPARTVHETVTVRRAAPPAPPPPASPPPPSHPPASSASAASLNDQGYRLMQSGRYGDALPLLQQAVAKLRGTYSSSYRYEAWASYNLAYTLLKLGRCGEALPLLDRSEHLQGHRVEIDRARASAQACA